MQMNFAQEIILLFGLVWFGLRWFGLVWFYGISIRFIRINLIYMIYKHKSKKLNISKILNKSWQQHPTRHQLYGHLPLSRNLFKLGEPDMQDIAGEAEMNS